MKERPANGGQDWYFIAYGHDYKAALKDYTLFAGKYHYLPGMHLVIGGHAIGIF